MLISKIGSNLFCMEHASRIILLNKPLKQWLVDNNIFINQAIVLYNFYKIYNSTITSRKYEVRACRINSSHETPRLEHCLTSIRDKARLR